MILTADLDAAIGVKAAAWHQGSQSDRMDVNNAAPSQLTPECMAECRMLYQFGDVMIIRKGCLARARDLFYAGPQANGELQPI